MLDTTKIEGYAEMSAEEKVKALESLEIETPDTDELTRLKNALNKASADAAEWKRQFREKQTEQERAEADAKELREAQEKELNELRREKEISKYEAEYLALGYDKELANATATAMANGETAKVFENQKLFNERKEAEYKANLLNAQPSLTQGENPVGKTITKEEIINIKDRGKRLEQIAEHPELF